MLGSKYDITEVQKCELYNKNWSNIVRKRKKKPTYKEMVNIQNNK